MFFCMCEFNRDQFIYFLDFHTYENNCIDCYLYHFYTRKWHKHFMNIIKVTKIRTNVLSFEVKNVSFIDDEGE